MVHFELKFPVRYYETDQMGVVHHSNYIRYFECARNGMMADLGLPIEVVEREHHVMIPIISVECRFRHPARMGDTLTVTADIERMPLAKLYVKQSVRNQDGQICAEGQVVLGFINAETFVPVPCPQAILDTLQKADA